MVCFVHILIDEVSECTGKVLHSSGLQEMRFLTLNVLALVLELIAHKLILQYIVYTSNCMYKH